MNRTLRTLFGGVLLLTIATAIVMAQQEVRIVQEAINIGAPVPGPGPGGPTTPLPMGTGLIFGQVVDGGSTRPVGGALVTLNLSGTTPIRALADGQGRFAFRDLPKGRFNLSATKPGYVDGAYGRMRPAGPTLPFELSDGERASGVSISLWKYAAIAGFVTDEQGDPLVNASVRTLKRAVVGGQWRLTPGPQDATDDRGAYRIGMLEPGEYVVVVPMNQGERMIDLPPMGGDGARDVMTFVAAARVSVATGGGGGDMPVFIDAFGGPSAGVGEDGRALAYPTQFYPTSASAARATVIPVGSGEERTNVDFQLKPVRTTKVSGTATGPDGAVGSLMLTLSPADSSELVSSVETLTTVTDSGGAFTFQSVPPGQYTLRASRSPRVAFGGPGETTVIQQGGAVMVTRSVTNTGAPPPLPTDPVLWAEMMMPVGNTDITDAIVPLRPGLRVTGTLQFDGAAARPTADQLPSIFVSLESADVRPGAPGNARGRVEPSGTFATMGVPPGRYFVRVAGAPSGWTFRGATLGGRDVTDTALEIDGDVTGVMLSFTDRPTQLGGNVLIESGSPEGATIIVFPTDSNAWTGYGSTSRRLRTARADKTGGYTISNLPAGEYFIAAVPDKIAADWQNPRFLEGLTSGATRIRLADGEKRSENVKVSR